MSLILDALNKADRQRDHQAPVPNLGSYHSEPSAVNKEPKVIAAWAIYTVIGLLVLVIFALVLLLFKGDGAPQNDKHNQQAQQANLSRQHLGNNPDVSRRPELPDTASVKAENAYMPVISEEVAAIYRRLGDQPENDQSVKKPVLKLSNSQLAKQQEPVADLYDAKINKSQVNTEKTSSPIKSEPSLPASQEIQAMWDATKQEAADAQPQITPSDPYKSIPYLHQLPDSFKDRIPTVNYENHIYSPKGAAVILNGRTYRAGDTLAQDLVIDAITQEDLVLSYLQKPFKLAALSSWIQAQ